MYDREDYEYNRGKMKFNLKLKPGELNVDEISVPLAVLATIATVGLVALVVAVPGTVQVLKLFKKNKNHCPSRVKICLEGLIKKGLIIKDKEGRLKLSSKGELRLLKYQEDLKPKKRWDGKWRIVAFDIWEKSRKKRDFLRRELSDFGFIKLQNSVWISPHECEDYINLLKTDVGLGRSVIYIVADRIDNEEKFKKIFGLA